MSSIPQQQYSSVDDGPSHYPASELGQSAVPSEGLLPIQFQPNISGHQETLVTSALSVEPIHQSLHQATSPGPNAEMCTPANSGSGSRQRTRQSPALHGTSSSSEANQRKTPENQINPSVLNFRTFNQTLLNFQGDVNDSNSFEPYLHVDVNPEKISSAFEPISAHIPLKLKDKAWKGEFINLSLLLKSARELVNEPNLEGDLAIKRVF